MSTGSSNVVVPLTKEVSVSPKNSYVHGQGCIKNIDDQAKIIKKLLINIGILPSDGKVKYRGTNVCWTKETGNENFINNIELVLGEY